LSSLAIVSIDSYWGTFVVFVSFDFEDFAVLPVDELVFLELEYLEPVRVGTPDLHIVGSS
jgi:hypothetical protein